MAPSLVLLLPHGYEGQGPDHSSARLERFLQSAADLNMRIANCTTAAQYFHLLRRQALLLGTDPLPLVMLTPKSLLRHPMVASTPRELAEGALPAGDRRRAAAKAAGQGAARWCCAAARSTSTWPAASSGKASPHVALARVEQIYPFPADQHRGRARPLPAAARGVLGAGRAENMGAWEFVRPLLEQLIDGRWPLRYVGRVRNSSPSEGSAAWHQVNQRAVVDQAFEETRRREGTGSRAVETGLDGLRLAASGSRLGERWTGTADQMSVTNIVVPELGESVVEARVARWLKNEGDQVAAGEALVELETEKIDLEVSADRAGVLTSIKHARGRRREGRRGAGAARSVDGAAAAPAAAPAAAAARGRAGPAAADVRATPTARNVAREHAVKLEAVPASRAAA